MHCEGQGPYSVGCNYIIYNEDGTLPLRGACVWDNMPPDTKHISMVSKTVVKKGQSSITNFMVTREAVIDKYPAEVEEVKGDGV